jgi:S-adenosylmethionine:tRNA ribosyltransferase-isomerase
MVRIEDYDYQLPDSLIATEPTTPRDHSRLFVYDTATDTLAFDHFYNLDHYLPKNSLMVFNRTKVVPARITLTKETGGKVVCLFLVNELDEAAGTVPVFVDRKVVVGQTLTHGSYAFTVLAQYDTIFTLSLPFSKQELFSLLEKEGSMPIPPYLKHTTLSPEDLKTKYQSMFAKRQGSAAAPTASLHFTHEVMESIRKKGIQSTDIVLHVGMGTFAPISDEQVKSNKLHQEWVVVPKESMVALKKARTEGIEITAVGTTVVRTLETVARELEHDPTLDAYEGSTDIFIQPSHRFHLVDHLITNFHLPKSSLMMLVDAFLKDKQAKRHVVELYEIAIKENFRFYSFGDAMLIL